MSTATKPHTQDREAPAERRKWGWLLFAGLLAAGSGGAAWYYHEKGPHAATGGHQAGHAAGHEGTAGQAADALQTVATVKLSRGGIVRTSTQIGSVHPYEEADLYAKVSGYLKSLHVNYGDRVKEGQLLAEIDDPEVVADAVKAEADVRQAQAAVAQARAFVEAAKADRDATASSIEQAEAEVDRYASMRIYHSKKAARYKRLVQNRAIPQEVSDEEDEAYESARANELASRKAVLKAKADLVAAKARVKKAEADLEEAKAAVAVSEARRTRAEALLGYTKIPAPYDGVITKRNFFRGAFIRSAAEGGTLPLLTVARTDKVYVVTEVPDRDVPYADVGDEAEVTLDALSGEVFKGKVSRFAEAEDPTSRTMHTEIDLPNPKNRLRAGMYGIAKIILDKDTRNSTLPASCLVGESKDGKGDVYVIEKGKVAKRQVEVGADDGLRVEIVSGLSPNDEVISDTNGVTEGSAVRGEAASDFAEPSRPAQAQHAAAPAGPAKGGHSAH